MGLLIGLSATIILMEVQSSPLLYQVSSSLKHIQENDNGATSPNIRKGNLAPESREQSRRKFIAYHSSAWEEQWLQLATHWDKVHDYQNYSDSLLNEQLPQIHDFMLATCTDQMPAPYEQWCVQNDFYRPFFYNTQNRSAIEWLCADSPHAKHLREHLSRAQPLGPLNPEAQKYNHIFSRFIFRDEHTGEEFTEYIEPLVAGLRHPLARLHYGGLGSPNKVLDFRGYLLPPPPPRQPSHQEASQRRIYLDAGASQWSSGLGGPSLSYFSSAWKRQGLELTEIYAYEPTTTVEAFEKTVPEEYKARTKFWQTYIASSPESATPDQPFLPLYIKETLKAQPEDYVLWKLDIDSPDVEDGSIQYLLEHHDKIHVDEIAWEHHIKDHPVMGKIWKMGGGPAPADVTLRQSYDCFLQLRQRGIRAHSWV